MAVRKINESTLTAIGNAIRSKTGGSALINPEDMASEIESIQTGGGINVIDYVNVGTGLFQDATIPEDVRIHFMYLTSLISAFRSSKGVKNIVLSSEQSITNMTTFAFNCSVEQLDVSGLKTVNCNFNGAFWNCTKMTDLFGLNLKGATNVTNIFQSVGLMSNMTVVENCCSIPISYASCSQLSDDSLISIANSLIAGSSTITFASASRTRLNAITGIITQKTGEDSNTYDFFTADENGTVTLMDFITNTKGWTVA